MRTMSTTPALPFDLGELKKTEMVPVVELAYNGRKELVYGQASVAGYKRLENWLNDVLKSNVEQDGIPTTLTLVGLLFTESMVRDRFREAKFVY